MATGRHSHISVIKSKWRPDTQCIQYLCAIIGDWIYSYYIPHHTDSWRTGKYRLPSNIADMYGMAMVGHKETQQERSTLGYVLYIHITNRVYSLCMLFMGWLYTSVGTAAHLVDHAAHMHTHHNLYLRLSEDV